MDALDIIDEHLAIRETVGYEVLNEVPIEDMPTVLNFLKIVYNYNRMKRVAEQEKREETSDYWNALRDHLGEDYKRYKEALQELSDQKEERELIKKILDDPRNADGFSDDSHRYPKYKYDGYTYILNDNLTKIMSVSLERDASRWHLEESLKERDKVTKKFKLEDSFKATLESVVKGDVPAKSWMDAHKEDYVKLQLSGEFYKLHPDWTGDWERDKYAFCHEQRFKKK